MWALVMAVVAMVAAAASSAADGSTGGAATDGGLRSAPQQGSGCEDATFGERTLRRGDCGQDVKTLNWILNSNPISRSAPLGRAFEAGTDRGVTRFQRRLGLRADGVVGPKTGRELVRRNMRRQRATWYGPGFYGNRTACGQRLRPATVGVAHRSLPCGSRVAIRYRGRFLRTRVIDRGPYAHGAHWDLTNGAREKLRFNRTDQIRVAAIR